MHSSACTSLIPKGCLTPTPLLPRAPHFPCRPSLGQALPPSAMAHTRRWLHSLSFLRSRTHFQKKRHSPSVRTAGQKSTPSIHLLTRDSSRSVATIVCVSTRRSPTTPCTSS